ncbi:MAG: enoyl-CoA hydratase [Betaproteobacteria bacterium]|nr:enoyl-CoA hydratase [Betaproteobacteria bacterium]
MPEIITRIDGAVGTVVFANPAKLNAMSMDMWSRLPVAVAQFDANPAVRVIVLKGEGEKAFISGADISQFERLRGTVAAQAEYNQAVENAYTAPMRARKPVIASIRGICIGGGLGLAASCDLRICAEDAVFRMPAARLGLGYSPAGVRRFMNVIGAANTLEIFTTAKKFGAAEALRMGFVSRVVPVAELEKATAETCRMIAENAPLTVAAAKFAVQQALKDPQDRDMKQAMQLVETCFASEDHKEGRKAFMEKRSPQFHGR